MSWWYGVPLLAVQIACLGWQIYTMRVASRYRQLLAGIAARSFMLTAAPIYKIWAETMGHSLRMHVETIERDGRDD